MLPQNAYELGVLAYEAGLSEDKNPFKKDTESWFDWGNGWDAARFFKEEKQIDPSLN